MCKYGWKCVVIFIFIWCWSSTTSNQTDRHSFIAHAQNVICIFFFPPFPYTLFNVTVRCMACHQSRIIDKNASPARSSCLENRSRIRPAAIITPLSYQEKWKERLYSWWILTTIFLLKTRCRRFSSVLLRQQFLMNNFALSRNYNGNYTTEEVSKSSSKSMLFNGFHTDWHLVLVFWQEANHHCIIHTSCKFLWIFLSIRMVRYLEKISYWHSARKSVKESHFYNSLFSGKKEM